jgi:aspartokinase
LLNSEDCFFALCKGVTETTIITSDKHRDTIERLFVSEKIIASTQNLASVTVKLPYINTEIYGIYYYILKQLAWEGINIIEVISTANEFTVLVAQDDVDKAFKILMHLKRGF